MRTANRSNGGRGSIPIDPTALLYGITAMAAFLVICAILITIMGIAVEWEPSRAWLRGFALLCMGVGGMLAGRKCLSRAWANGLLTAVISFAALTWISGSFGVYTSVWGWIRSLLLSGFIGMVGGIIGGLKDKKA